MYFFTKYNKFCCNLDYLVIAFRQVRNRAVTGVGPMGARPHGKNVPVDLVYEPFLAICLAILSPKQEIPGTVLLRNSHVENF